ncbi:hypothetical protein BKA93DRAFT_338428 [Sparassis latifolia]
MLVLLILRPGENNRVPHIGNTARTYSLPTLSRSCPWVTKLTYSYNNRSVQVLPVRSCSTSEAFDRTCHNVATSIDRLSCTRARVMDI